VSCSCLWMEKPITLSEAFAETPTIFIGRIINKVHPAKFDDEVEYTMKVEEVFKVT
jgi:hypothetical protein